MIIVNSFNDKYTYTVQVCLVEKNILPFAETIKITKRFEILSRKILESQNLSVNDYEIGYIMTGDSFRNEYLQETQLYSFVYRKK